MRGAPVGSEFNREVEVTQNLAFPDDVFLVDSTIRSLQSTWSGSRHTLDDLVEIGVALDGVGVRELIVNVTWRDGLEVIEGLKNRDIGTTVVATFGAGRDDWRVLTQDAVSAGADQVCFESVPSEDALREAVSVAHDYGAEASHAFRRRPYLRRSSALVPDWSRGGLSQPELPRQLLPLCHRT